MASWSNPGYLIAQQTVEPVSWSGRPLTLVTGLLESELANGGLLWSLCSQSVSAPLLSRGFMSSFNSCPEPCPFPVSMVCSTYCLDQWESRRGLCEGGEEVEKPSNLRAALQQPRAPGSSFSNAMGEHLASCLLRMLGWPESEQVFLLSDIPACLLVFTPFLPDSYVHTTTIPSPTSATALYLLTESRQMVVQYLGFGPPTCDLPL